MIKMFIFVAEKKEPFHPIVSRLDFFIEEKKQKKSIPFRVFDKL